MNENYHYDEAERLINEENGHNSIVDALRAVAHAVLALVETEESSTVEIHELAEHIAKLSEGEDDQPHPGGLA